MFDIWPVFKPRKHPSVKEALMSDWEAVGRDFKKVIGGPMPNSKIHFSDMSYSAGMAFVDIAYLGEIRDMTPAQARAHIKEKYGEDVWKELVWYLTDGQGEADPKEDSHAVQNPS